MQLQLLRNCWEGEFSIFKKGLHENGGAGNLAVETGGRGRERGGEN